jgi:hypothetical protein
MTFYGLADANLADSELGEVFEMFVEREQAVPALQDVLQHEPGWADRIRLVEIELVAQHGDHLPTWPSPRQSPSTSPAQSAGAHPAPVRRGAPCSPRSARPSPTAPSAPSGSSARNAS